MCVAKSRGATVPEPQSPPPASPPHDCPLCPRLVAYRTANRAANPTWFNAPVPSVGPLGAPILVVGMAPGVKGANRTGRPFTGDHAGLLLYETLLRFGLATGHYAPPPEVAPDPTPTDTLAFAHARITNAVRCVPPKNLPEPAETRTCNPFLASELAVPGIRAVLALGVLSHTAVLRAAGLVPSRTPFKHGATLPLPGGALLFDCYHVSRYNTNTGVLTSAMFADVVAAMARHVGTPVQPATSAASNDSSAAAE